MQILVLISLPFFYMMGYSALEYSGSLVFHTWTALVSPMTSYISRFLPGLQSVISQLSSNGFAYRIDFVEHLYVFSLSFIVTSAPYLTVAFTKYAEPTISKLLRILLFAAAGGFSIYFFYFIGSEIEIQSVVSLTSFSPHTSNFSLFVHCGAQVLFGAVICFVCASLFSCIYGKKQKTL